MSMATLKRVFTLRMEDEIFDNIEQLAKDEHRSLTNMIEYILLKYIDEHKKTPTTNEHSSQHTEKGGTA